MIASRRPHLTTRVSDGLASIARRIVPEDADEEMALLWIHRVHRWRLLSSALLDPQDAERLSPERGGGITPASPGETEETNH